MKAEGVGEGPLDGSCFCGRSSHCLNLGDEKGGSGKETPILWFPAGASHWRNPAGSQKAKKPIGATLRGQPSRAQRKAEEGREWIWGRGDMQGMTKPSQCQMTVRRGRLSKASAGWDPAFIKI